MSESNDGKSAKPEARTGLYEASSKETTSIVSSFPLAGTKSLSNITSSNTQAATQAAQAMLQAMASQGTSGVEPSK